MNPTQSVNEPDPVARWFSHLVVGAIAAAFVTQLVGRRSAPAAQIITFLVAAALHEAFDAPVARKLAELGA